MKKLTLAFALLLTATAAAHAQSTPTGSSYPPGSNDIYPKKIKDPVQLDEAHIANSRLHSAPAEREAALARYNRPRTFKAVVEVTNHATQAIRSVDWTATLLDPITGDVISTYDVTTKSNIAPGKTKKFSKNLRTPQTRVVSATSPTFYPPRAGKLTVEVKAVTYADGTTSTTP